MSNFNEMCENKSGCYCQQSHPMSHLENMEEQQMESPWGNAIQLTPKPSDNQPQPMEETKKKDDDNGAKCIHPHCRKDHSLFSRTCSLHVGYTKQTCSMLGCGNVATHKCNGPCSHKHFRKHPQPSSYQGWVIKEACSATVCICNTCHQAAAARQRNGGPDPCFDWLAYKEVARWVSRAL